MNEGIFSAPNEQSSSCRTISEVIQKLEAIVAQKDSGRMAWFAAVYLHMTKAVDKAIQQRLFEDNERMERLDVLFANRYLDAIAGYREGRPVSACWNFAFTNNQQSDFVVLQHILTGMNAHINYDLALAAAATVSTQEEIIALKQDFVSINDLIATLAGDIQARLTQLWWPMRFITRLAKGKEKAVLNFSVVKAREASYANAVALVNLPKARYDNYCKMLDQTVAAISQKIITPDWMTRILLKPVKLLEEKDPQKVTQILAEKVS